MNYELRIKNKIIFLFFYFFVLMMIMPALAFAWSIGDPIVPCGGAGQPHCDFCQLDVLANNFISFMFFVLIMPAGTIALIISGILILTAAGDPGKITRGKAIFSQVIIGLVIAFGAWLIIDLILGNLIDPGYISIWNKFPTCTLFK